MEASSLVRFIFDASKVEVTTGRVRKGPVNHYQVQFPTGLQWIPENQFVRVTENEDAFDLFANGRFGGARDLHDRITHVRISGRLADYLYSLESTNTEFHAFQYKPMAKILNSPSGGLLIADVVWSYPP